MPSFLHPTLFWTLGLPTLGAVAIPVLIHLINMMRHRRIQWAAMEFLLLSQKKNRTWVLLKQLLLLLLRMAAVAAIVLLVAQPVLRSRWGGLLGSTRTHHVVLLDDSFSMSDRWDNTDAFTEAKKVIDRIGREAARQAPPQALTLLRFSRAARTDQVAEPDVLKQPVSTESVDSLSELLTRLKVTETAAGPLPALRAIPELLGPDEGDRRVIYLVSDFRTRQWQDPRDLRDELLRLSKSGAEVHLVNCVDRARPNLAIASLEPAAGIRAAGVPWFMEVSVENFGTGTAQNVSVVLGEDGHGRPAVTLPKVPPGKVVKERFLVQFSHAGRHDITVRLESDAVAADNYRYYSVDLPVDVPVLLVDGDAETRDARYLSLALSPSGPVRTGIRPQVEAPRYLSLKPLDSYATINLANVERLDASAVAALEKYVAAGGGVAFFLGEHSDPKYFNESLYRDGKGLFPIPLKRPAELVVDRLEPAPDVEVSDHFIFRVFAAKQNPLLRAVAVERYMAVPDGWRPARDSTVRVVARLRNGALLVVERSFGKGRVLAFLTSAGPSWNNWARNPSFVVVMQDLQSYLSQRPGEDRQRLVGSPLEISLDPAVYQPSVRFELPESSMGEGGNAAAVTLNASPSRDGPSLVSLRDTSSSGFYEARLARIDGAPEARRYAVNVDATEGDLATSDAEQLAARLEGVNYHYDQAAAFQSANGNHSGYNLSDALLYALVFLLLVEQVFAWSASYHPVRRATGTVGRTLAPAGDRPGQMAQLTSRGGDA